MKYIEGEFNFQDPNGISHDSPFEYVLTILLGICGCQNDEIKNDIHQILTKYYTPTNTGTYFTELGIEGPEKYIEVLLTLLDKAGLIEHGTSIRGSWLTPKGREVCEKYLERTIGKE